MRELILEKLAQIEKRENVKILHCVESGSRAWGFASPDSDYDVRFIYVRKREFYLRLDKTRDVIEWQLDDTLDISGWDLQKTLILLHNSNPTPFEWNVSPIVYKTTDEWSKISNVMNRYFVAKSGIYHYLSTAKRNYGKFLTGDTIKYKKYFYVLRPLLACKWIVTKGTPPPIEFSILMEKYLEGDVKGGVERILNLKINSPETAVGPRLERVNEYLEKTISEMEEIAAALPNDKVGEWSELNDLFFELTK